MEIREALEAKMDEIESESDGAAPVPEAVEASPDASPDASTEPAPSDTSEQTAAERARDEAGRFAKAEKAAEAKAKPLAAAKAIPAVPGKAPATAAPPVAGAPVTPTVKAPQSWKPALRELALKLPAEFRPLLEEVNRRERETAIAIQKASEAGKGVQPWQDAVRPYEAQIRAAGAEPVKYVESLLQTAHSLQYGSEGQKADRLAEIIMQFGVTPQSLDQALVARMQGRPAQSPQGQGQYRDPRVDQLFSQLEQAKTQRVQAQEAEATQTLEQFSAAHDFAGDVSEEMANILDAWAKGGKTTVTQQDLERAYNIACQMNPDVAPLLEQRKAYEAAKKAAASTSRARTAASSVRSSPTAAPAAQPAGLRAVLEAKADELGWVSE